MARDKNWVENQLLAIRNRLEEELKEYTGDENKSIRHRIHVEHGIVSECFYDVRDLDI